VCNSNDPVNCATGEFWQQFSDFNIPGRGVALNFTRTYVSGNAATNGPLGYGWTDSYNWSLSFDSLGDVTVNQEDGSTVEFTPTGSGTFTAPPRVLASLVENGNGTYTFTRFSNGIAYNFSSAGQLESEVDRNGYATTLNYTGSELTSVTDPAGRSLTFSYSGSNISQVTDPIGRAVTFTYDSGGNLTGTTDADGRSWSFTYDPNHLLLTMTDPRGGVTTNTYDTSNQVVSQVNAVGQTTTWSYSGDAGSPTGGSTTMTDPEGSETIYDSANLELTSVTQAAGTAEAASTSYTYDPATLGIATVTDPNGHVTSYTYDAEGNELTTTDALGSTTTFTYNGLNEVASETTPLGDTTSYSYDGNGNLLSMTDPLGNTYTYSYGDADPGDVTSVADPDGDVTTTTYESQGDEMTVSTSPSVGVTDTTEYAYDVDSERTCMASPDAVAKGVSCPAAGAPYVVGTTSYTYDSVGELVASTNANGRATSFSYDADGNQTQQTNPDGDITTTTYDLLNRPVTVTAGENAASPSMTSSTYDVPAGAGACSAAITGATYCDVTTNANGGVTVAYYNAAEELIAETLPGGQTSQFTYDPAGNETTMVDAAGRTTTDSHDADNRVTAVSYSDGTTPDVSYTYDADGNRLSMTDGTGTTTYTYDADGRLTSTTDGVGATVSYSYDGAGNVASLTYPTGRVATHTYDNAGLMVSTADGSGSTTSFAYDADGNLVSTVYPNGDAVESSYDLTDALIGTGVVPTSSPSSPLATITYSRDLSGLVTQESDSGALSGTTGYSYNAQQQLTSAGSGVYGYDATGDLTEVPGGTQTFHSSEELTASNVNGVTTSYTYDAVGERTGGTSPGSVTTYGYDQAGELTSYSATESTTSPPAVTSVSPASGPSSGGIAVTVTGSGFSGAIAVDFGAAAAASFQVNSATSITAESSAGTGTVDVTVTTPGGTSALVSGDEFTYASSGGGAPPPPPPTTTTTTTPITASPSPTSTAISVSPVSVRQGQPVMYRVTVSSAAGTPTGTVAFTSGSTDLCTATLSAGTGLCSATNAPVGADTITGTYPGDAGHAGSSGTTALSVTSTKPARGPLGYWLVTAGGSVYSFDAPRYGSPGGKVSGSPTVGIAANQGAGYWLVSSNGAVTAFGTRSYGSANSKKFRGSITAIAAALTGKGYWLVSSTGQVLPFGDAQNYGSATAKALRGTVVGISATASGKGYWLITSKGQVLAFGDAKNHGSVKPGTLNGVVAGIAVTTTGKGYWLVSSTGQVMAFGDAKDYGTLSPKLLHGVIVAITTDVATGGYWLAASDGSLFAFHAPLLGSVKKLGSGSKRVVGMASFDGTLVAAAKRRFKDSLHAFSSADPSAMYTYNGDGLRMTETIVATTEQFLWDTAASAPELLADSSSTYVYGPEGSPIEQITSGGTVDYYFHDVLGSTRLLLASSGAVDETLSYGAYGSTTSQSGTATTPFEYAGGYKDAVSGLYYLIHRYYDPISDQFLSVDPLFNATGEPYSYVGDNPINEVDGQGLAVKGVCISASLEGGLLIGAGVDVELCSWTGSFKAVTIAVSIAGGVGLGGGLSGSYSIAENSANSASQLAGWGCPSLEGSATVLGGVQGSVDVCGGGAEVGGNIGEADASAGLSESYTYVISSNGHMNKQGWLVEWLYNHFKGDLSQAVSSELGGRSCGSLPLNGAWAPQVGGSQLLQGGTVTIE
jgi:RHS repeat-associated protein